MKRIPLLALLFFMIPGCEKWNDDSTNQYVAENAGLDHLEFNKTICLEYGACLSDRGMQNTICFDSVLTDSRCPENVVCFWAGEAIVRFRFESFGKESRIVDLHTGTMDTLINGYRFSFMDLLPYPNTEHQTSPEDYKARIILKRR